MCVCIFFFSWMRSGMGETGRVDEDREELPVKRELCLSNVWGLVESEFRNVANIVERGDIAILRSLLIIWGIEPIAIWAFHWLLESFWPWPGASETSDLKVSAFLSISLQCKSGYGFCFIVAENKIDGFLEKELPGVQEGKVLWAAWFIFI